MQFNWNDPTAIMFAIYLVDRKSTRLNSSHLVISYAVFCLKKKKKKIQLFLSRQCKTELVYNRGGSHQSPLLDVRINIRYDRDRSYDLARVIAATHATCVL